MNKKNQYSKIQQFKNSRSAVIGGINYANVIAVYLYDTSLFGLLRKTIFSLFFTTTITQAEQTDCKLRIFYSCRHKKRKDYDYIINRIREIADKNGDYAESSETLSITQCGHSLLNLPSAWRSTKGYHSGRRHKLAAALLIAKYLSSADILNKLLEGKQRMVTFCDSQPIENLITQIALSSGLHTTTTQHGQYRILNEGNISPDAEVYENFISDKMLCWGEATRTEFGRAAFDPNRFIVTGWIRRWDKCTNPLAKPKTGVFGVMLNGENGKKSNPSLIETAEKIADALGLNYLIRLHPLNNQTEYRNTASNRCHQIARMNMKEYLSKVDFSIAHMSGAIIEMLHESSPVYLLDDGRLAEVFRIDNLSYQNADSMISSIRHDLIYPDQCLSRTTSLYKWFNDDLNQEINIQSALLN